MQNLFELRNVYSHRAIPLGIGIGFGVFVVSLLVVWSFYWKGRALWRAAQKEDKVWFIVLLMVNTLGIFDILYLYKFGKREETAEIEEISGNQEM